MFKDIFPPVETVLEMEPEELAPFVLKYLNTQKNINRYNFSLGTAPEFIEYAGGRRGDVMEGLMVAWMWLEKELFIAPKPGESGDWAFITPRGRKVLEEQNFDAYKKESTLPSDYLDPILVRKVKPSFIRGDYETAIFQAFKEVEVRVRKAGGYDKEEIGVPLMRKAFHPETGKLTNKEATGGEKQAMMDLFAGAVGLFKNPVSHRSFAIAPEQAADAIQVANCLLKILG